MCVPKIPDIPKPPAPPPPPNPLDIAPPKLETDAGRSAKKRGRSALRIDRTTPSGGGSGLSI